MRKLSLADIVALEQRPLGARAEIAREYDAYLADFAIGDYGRVELAEGERRTVVRARLQAAARRRDLVLRFRPGPGAALVFHVEAVPSAVAKPAAPAAAVDQRGNGVARGREPVRQLPRRPESSAERYRAVLPRWMREEQPAGRPDRSKRRAK